MKTLGKYEILDEIACGGMGKICRARDRVLKREAAIKTIYTGETDPEIRQRFYREARACAALGHPNIVTIFDLGEQQGITYIAMEFLDGEDLRRFIDREGLMSLEAKIDFITGVCEGLAYAHENRVVHRDIKPGNIFILKSGRPKILDFGVARISESRLTQPGTPLGTPRYMAPEQLLGKEADSRSDLFSATMVFYEFLVYKHPFNDGDVSANIIKGEYHPIRHLNPALPERLDRIFSKALSKDPNERYQTGSELAKELKKVSLDIVRDCSRIWNDVQENRKRILDLKPNLDEYLNTSWVRSALENGNADLTIVDKIAPEVSSTILAETQYFDLVALLNDAQKTGALLSQIVDEVKRARVGVDEARSLLQSGDIEGAARILHPLAERFVDHQETVSLMKEIQIRLLAVELEKALAASNLVSAFELLNEVEALGCESPEAMALVEPLRSRVADLSAAKDMLCDSLRASLRQLQGAVAGNDIHKIEKLLSSVQELGDELALKYERGIVPDEVKTLLSSCEQSHKEADVQIVQLKIKEALDRGDLAAVRISLQDIKERCQSDPRWGKFLAKLQIEVMGSIFGVEFLGTGRDAALAMDAPTLIMPPTDSIGHVLHERTGEQSAMDNTVFHGLGGEPEASHPNPAATWITPNVADAGVSSEANASDWICSSCGTSNPVSSALCNLCGGRSPDISQSSNKAPQEGVAALAAIVRNHIQLGIRRLASWFMKLQVWQRVALPSAVLVLIMIPIAYWHMHPAAKDSVPAFVIGKARVLEGSAPLRSQPRDDAQALATISRGVAVDMLGSVPEKNLDAWVLVRPQIKQSANGYLRLRQLAGAETGVSSFDLWHARSLIPDPSGSDPSLLQTRLKEGEIALSRIAANAESINLRARLAAGYAVLATKVLPDRSAAAKYVDLAERYMEDIPAADSEKTRTILAEMEKRLPSPTSIDSQANVDVSKLVRQARAEFDRGEYAKAARICEKAVSLNPHSREAADLMQRTNAAKKLKEKLLSAR
jgi:serine/threonine protein kinase